jgi:hypothetical protein
MCKTTTLNDQHLDFVLQSMAHNTERARMNAMLQVLKRIIAIRRFYAMLEIGAPVAFAIFVILYVRFR